MGTVVMPKNSADLDVLNPILEFYYEKNDWVENSDYIAYIKKYLLDNGIDDKEREPQHYTKRMQILAYFGFIEWEEFENSQSNRRITALGKKFYEAIKSKNQGLIDEVILKSLTKTVFGRNNFGAPNSNSDIEAPIVCIRAILDLSFVNKIEFAYLLYKMQDNGFTYSTIIKEIQNIRAGKLKPIQLPEEANKYTDWKPINFLERFNFLETENSETRININVLKNYKNQLKNLKIYNVDKDVEFENLSPSSPKATKPAEPYEQIVFYGVPGSGKSYKIDNEKTDGASDYQKQKVVFQPDYTNSDFIGQIIPKMKETGEGENKKSVIEYSFKPGPFTTILRRALRDKKHQYYLLIEEINRGNAAAIFGDLFQLLDRDDDGWSCSPVNNDDINFYIASEYEFWEDKYSDSHPYGAESVNHPDGTEQFSRNTGIMLPPNFSIYATMNTNDQNVFTLDNAFNRRFLSEYISNKEDSKNKAHCNQFNLKIGETGIYWGNFRNLINEEIIGSGFINAEDKQLGLFFIKKSRDFDGITAKDFSDKVLKYLWHDVFKRDKNIFKGSVEIKSFEDLIDNFNGKDAFGNCFDADFVAKLKEGNNPLSYQPKQAE